METAYQLLHEGGDWLRATRSWIQSNCRNGEQVTWGSRDVLYPQLTVYQIEEVCAYAVSAALNEENKRRQND